MAADSLVTRRRPIGLGGVSAPPLNNTVIWQRSFSYGMSTPSPGLKSRALLSDEDLEPYVRKQRSDSTEPNRRRLLALDEEEQNLLRTSINSRERKRMHDLNEALEELRSCLPYSQDQSARKMSKINTLLLACNWIRQLTIRNHELQKQVAALRAEDRISVPIGPPPPSSQPSNNAFTISPGPINFAIGPTPCMKAYGQACFCIACITMRSKQ